MEKAGASLESQDEFDQPSTFHGSGKMEDVNQNLTPATANNTENVSSNAAVPEFDAERFRNLTWEELDELCDCQDYFAHYPEDIKEKAKQILNETNELEQQKVMDLFHVLRIKPFFREMESTTKEIAISVEGDIELDFYIMALKSKIHSKILHFFRNMLT